MVVCFKMPTDTQSKKAVALRGGSACEKMMTILEEEKDILQEKLQIHMGLWALDKKQLEDDHIEAVRASRETGSAQAYEIAKLNLTLNSEKQRSHSTECKLEDAIAEIDKLQRKVVLLNNLLKQEKEKVDAAENRVSSQGVSRELLHAAVARESEKYEQANQKIHQLQELLEAAKVTHRQQVDALRADCTEKKAETDGRMQRLQHEMDVSLKKNECLEEELCKCQSQRKSLAKWLVNESSFLNGQLKTLDTRYAARLQEKDKQLNKAREDFEQLQRTLEDVQRRHDENGVQDILLKLKVMELEKEAANVKDVLAALVKEDTGLECQNLQIDLQQKTLEIDRFSAILSSKECVLENLSLEKEALYDQLEQTKKDKRKAAREFVAAEKEHKKQLKELEKQCTAATKLVEKKEDKVQKLEQQLEQLQHKEHSTGSEKFSRKIKVEEGNKKQLREIEKKYTEVVTEKEELLKKMMGQLDKLHDENENLKAQRTNLESLEKINKAEAAHPKQMKELEKLVAVQAEKLRKLSQQLENSEKTCSKVEAYWTHQNSEAEEIHKKDLKDIEKRCTDTTKLVHEKEEALKKVKHQLEALQKKNKSLKTQVTRLGEHDAATEVQQARPRTRNGKTSSAATTETLQDAANVPIEPSSEVSEKESGSSRREVSLNERRKQGGFDIPQLPQARPRARKSKTSSGATAETLQDAASTPREQSAEVPETESGSSKRGVSLNKRRKKVPVESGSTTANFTRVVEQAMDKTSKEDDLQSAGEAARDNDGASLPMQRKGSANKGPIKRKAKEGTDPTPPEKKRPPMHPSTSRLSSTSRKSDTGQLLPAQLLMGSNTLLPKTNIFSAAFSVPRLKSTSSGSRDRYH